MKMHVPALFKRVLALTLVLTTILCAVPFAGAASSSELKKKLSGLENQESEVRSKIKSLQKKADSALEQKEYYDKQISILDDEIAVQEEIIAEYDGQIGELDGEISKLSDRIASMETEITVKQHEHDELYDNFKTRIRVMYEEDITSYAGIVLMARSVGDLLERLEAVMNILRADRQTMTKLNKLSEEIAASEKQVVADKEAVEADKAEVVTLRDEQKAEKKKLDQKKDDLSEKQAEAKKLVSSLTSQLEDNKDLLASIESQENKVEKEIKEAAAKEAEKESNNSSSGSSSGRSSGGGSNSGNSSNSGSGKLAWPTPGYNKITCYYGYRTHPVTGKKNSFHTGIDIGAPGGTAIKCAAAGTVTKKCYNSAYGNMIVVSHGNGLSTMYAHMKSSALYSVGDKVSQGTTLGYVGSTGLSTGNHLHFSVLKNGDYVNPLNYFD